MNPPANRRCWAEVNLSALCHNLEQVRKFTLPQTAILAVVKANAYGHGVGPVAKALAEKVEYFGTANVWEALELRKLVPKVPILILGPALPEERALVAEHGFIPVISNAKEAKDYSDLVLQNSWPVLDVHLAVDTGMGRIGVWYDEIVSLVNIVKECRGVRLAGCGTHLPVADEDHEWTEAELIEWQRVVGTIKELNDGGMIFHSLHSAGVMLHGMRNNGTLVRPGLMLYGSSPIPEKQASLQPVLTWKTRITLVRSLPAGRSISYGRTFITPYPMKVATLAVGYADGYPRSLSGQGAEVLVQGKRCAVLGRITMDQILVDVSSLEAVGEGEEVVLIGRQGEEEIFAAELAQKAGSIPWEIFTGLGNRVQRVYFP